MKFSYNWIRELVDGLDTDPKHLEQLITIKTAECEGIEPFEGSQPGCAPDSIIEIDNKSITHRPDLWGHAGMAREVAAITRRPFLDPVRVDLVPAGPSPARISIEDFELCPRYSALVFENISVQPSPAWLQCRLEAIGLNPINNIVDVTNYVMAEIAQPMHAFDADKLHGDTIFVRRARAGECLTALNEERYELSTGNLVIADAKGAIALGGVIGGLESAISDATKRIVLESANFQAVGIRRTSAELKLRTDASMRFEKSQDPANTVRGLARAIELLNEVCPGIRLVGGLADQAREIVPPPAVLLPLDWLVRKLGLAISEEEVRDILERLQFGVETSSPGVLSVTVPGWRSTRDISIKDDLVEEIGRMVGYDTITPSAPMVTATVPPANEERLFHHRVREMAAAQGYTEVYNYSFISEDMARAFHLEPHAHLEIANPINSDQRLMRCSLLPGIWKNIEENSRNYDSFRLFEIGLEIHKREDAVRLPDEIPHLAAAVYGRGDGVDGLFELKRLAECLMPGAVVARCEPRPYEHPHRSVALRWHGSAVGRLFELHPTMVAGRAAILDVNLQLVYKLQPGTAMYKPIRRFPSSAFDLSVIIGLRDEVGRVGELLAQFAGPNLEALEFVRQYSGPPLAAGQKSVSYRMTLAAADRTLSASEVSAVRNGIIEAMRAKGYDLRI
ncbi:MAG: phenylalanine--tRNA ligase subunit beta [Bryobacterales bacterium]|nr:phenylalanine--tRNA ligase subunit beta [Bryobacterales bacterium]